MQAPSEIFLVIISKYSQSCKMIMDKLRFIEPHFNTQLIDIDNIEDRKLIMNATKNQIQTVPTIFLIYPQNNKMDKYEGNGVLELIDKGVMMVQQKLQALEQSRPQKGNMKATIIDDLVPEEDDDNNSPHSNLEDVLEEELYDEEPRRVHNSQPQEEEFIDYGSAGRSKFPRKKVGKTGILPDRRYIGEEDELPQRDEIGEAEDEGDRMLTDRVRNHTPRMTTQRGPTRVAVKANKTSKNKIMVQDLTSLDEDGGDDFGGEFEGDDFRGEDNRPQGLDMNEILDPTQGMGQSHEQKRRSKEQQDRVAQLMAERDNILSREDVRPKRPAVSMASGRPSGVSGDPMNMSGGGRNDPYMDRGEQSAKGMQPQMSNAPIYL